MSNLFHVTDLCLLKELVLSEPVKSPFWRQQILRNVRYVVSGSKIGFFEVFFCPNSADEFSITVSCFNLHPNFRFLA